MDGIDKCCKINASKENLKKFKRGIKYRKTRPIYITSKQSITW
ncbi:Hypothetical protein EUBREC_3253 [Agathobacter rectalis ATCC 33656]|uniref:Uncharacterized protein n=1 Tax=Agathobacter rectalis (strain ATCC 33656 / DSM 3377 / JCM 17463 / KCTC 5835 / VPI 0990) TaxID=515619 RepID=C4ZDK4_AGARV|nr:Hypothetical protein EUBREC_3253 [Agathobacter rectalis ATCC 33656]